MTKHVRFWLLTLGWTLALGFLFGQATYAAEIEVNTVNELIQCATGDTSSPGDVCLVRAGVYTLTTTPLTINERQVHIRCADGPLACIIQGNQVKFGAQANRAVLGGPNSGFLIRSVQTGAAKLSAIVVTAGLEGIVIQGNRIERGTGGFQHGIEIQGDQRFLRIIDNEIINPQNESDTSPGHCIDHAAGTLIDVEIRGLRCTTSDGGSNGINLNGGSNAATEVYINVQITGGSACEITAANGIGINIEPTGGIRNLYISCTVRLSGEHGLNISPKGSQHIQGVTIEDSLFEGNHGAGARITFESSDSTGRIQGVVVNRSQFLGNEEEGFLIMISPACSQNSHPLARDIRDVTIIDSIAENNGTKLGHHGFEILAVSGCSNTNETNEYAPSNVMNVNLFNVTAKGNFDSGIRVATRENTDADADPPGDVINVTIEPNPDKSTLFGDNRIVENLRHGIVIEGQRNVVGVKIRGMTITGNGVQPALGWGIRIHALDAGVRNVMIGGSADDDKNVIEGNGEGGVEIEANNEISATSILNNHILNNPRFGIRIVTTRPSPIIGPAALISSNLIMGNVTSAGTPDGTRCGALDTSLKFSLQDITRAEGIGILIDAKNVEVRKNGIKCNEIGVKVGQNGSVTIQQNNLWANEDFGVDATLVLPEVVDATNNCWKAVTFPSPGVQELTDCDDPKLYPNNTVTNNVDTSDFLTGPTGVTDAPDPFVVIGDTQLVPGGQGRVVISLTAVPEPGVAGFQVGPEGVLTFDPQVIRVVRVDGVSPYQMLSSEIDNTNGRVQFAVTNPTGEDYLVGEGPVVVLTVEAAPEAQVGDVTTVKITKVDLMEAPSPDGQAPLVTTLFSGRVEIVAEGQRTLGGRGDLNLDGTVDITDARWVAEAAIGVRTLTPEEEAEADVAPPFGVIDITDARFLAEASLGLRAVSLPAEAAPTQLSLWEWLLRLLGLWKPADSANEVRVEPIAEGLRVELPSPAVEAQGELRYDPTQGEALTLEGVGGWVVLAQVLDSVQGVVKFAAVRLDYPQQGGALILRTAQGQLVGVQLHLQVLRDASGQDLLYRVRLAGQVVEPAVRMQAVSLAQGIEFRIQGQGVQAVALEVYDLAGRRVYTSGLRSGQTLRWAFQDQQGRPVANGVYLYVVELRGASGQIERTSVQKLLVLR